MKLRFSRTLNEAFGTPSYEDSFWQEILLKKVKKVSLKTYLLNFLGVKNGC